MLASRLATEAPPVRPGSPAGGDLVLHCADCGTDRLFVVPQVDEPADSDNRERACSVCDAAMVISGPVPRAAKSPSIRRAA
jgi:hypothetical protein